MNEEKLKTGEPRQFLKDRERGRRAAAAGGGGSWSWRVVGMECGMAEGSRGERREEEERYVLQLYRLP